MTSIVFASWLALWPFLFEKINKTRVVFSGESVPDKERILLLANHRMSEQKCIRSQKYAADHGLPVLKNVLLPKTKGFFACLEELRNSLDAVYDVTIGYKPRCPFFMDNVLGVNPSEVISTFDVSLLATSLTLRGSGCLVDRHILSQRQASL
ncbi:putative 1-acyl-sn-glycerol-3-phosphate acyltransferase 4 [Bienertia sinuspersici]